MNEKEKGYEMRRLMGNGKLLTGASIFRVHIARHENRLGWLGVMSCCAVIGIVLRACSVWVVVHRLVSALMPLWLRALLGSQVVVDLVAFRNARFEHKSLSPLWGQPNG
jgi:hypothetical protein